MDKPANMPDGLWAAAQAAEALRLQLDLLLTPLVRTASNAAFSTSAALGGLLTDMPRLGTGTVGTVGTQHSLNGTGVHWHITSLKHADCFASSSN